ncbi:tRNA-dihydrouridine synthase [Caballeronia sp. 15711]|uniref:oxidoreductase n=1 Tax=Caballeronia sp. 15711 TaxID=3391029 RepID=UPI0039E42945
MHCAHGYLIHEFLSPISNKRTDEFGGTLVDRMRYPLEVYDAVRAVWTRHKPLGVKVSATDWIDAGWDIEQTIEFAKALETRGIDWIDVSSGGISPLQKIALCPGYQVPFANQIKRATGVTTICVGLITDAKQAEEILSSDQADAVAIARGMRYHPRWAWHAAATLGATVEAPRPYWRAPPQMHAAVFGEVVNGAR